MSLLRSDEMRERYEAARKLREGDPACPLCDNPALKEFTHWKVMENNFPYDKVAKVHHMLLPRRHATEIELTAEEDRELIEIKESYVNAGYDFIFEASNKNKSVPKHFHVHLIVVRDDLK